MLHNVRQVSRSSVENGGYVLRSYLGEHPEDLARISNLRPEGPLAVSHRLGSTGVRYDHVLATKEFEVVDVRYVDVFGVSDHAAVVADLALTL